MNQEDDEFNRIERESKLRMEAVYQEVQKRNKALEKEYAYERGVLRGRELKRPWVGLTEEDLKLLSAEWRIVYGAWMDDFARDIEAKLKEKNT